MFLTMLFGAIYIIKSLIIMVYVLLMVAFYTVFERKIIAYMQRRKGPNVIGPFGLLQAIADALKLLVKKTVYPQSANVLIYFFIVILASLFVFTGLSQDLFEITRIPDKFQGHIHLRYMLTLILFLVLCSFTLIHGRSGIFLISNWLEINQKNVTAVVVLLVFLTVGINLISSLHLLQACILSGSLKITYCKLLVNSDLTAFPVVIFVIESFSYFLFMFFLKKNKFTFLANLAFLLVLGNLYFVYLYLTGGPLLTGHSVMFVDDKGFVGVLIIEFMMDHSLSILLPALITILFNHWANNFVKNIIKGLKFLGGQNSRKMVPTYSKVPRLILFKTPKSLFKIQKRSFGLLSRIKQVKGGWRNRPILKKKPYEIDPNLEHAKDVLKFQKVSFTLGGGGAAFVYFNSNDFQKTPFYNFSSSFVKDLKESAGKEAENDGHLATFISTYSV